MVVTAIHAGHELRPSLAARAAVDDATRFREEDPYTDLLAPSRGAQVTVHRSRFEVDLNRPRDQAVYASPEQAWGLELWREPLPAEEVERSLRLHDRFRHDLARLLDPIARRGEFVVLDLHSYNHRRRGPDAPAEPAADNPEVNLGTGSLDRERWDAVVERFLSTLGRCKVWGHQLDVRENVRFRGGDLSRWINERYDGAGCALAVEFKKTFMDEWTGVPDLSHLFQLRDALAVTASALVAPLRSRVLR